MSSYFNYDSTLHNAYLFYRKCPKIKIRDPNLPAKRGFVQAAVRRVSGHSGGLGHDTVWRRREFAPARGQTASVAQWGLRPRLLPTHHRHLPMCWICKGRGWRLSGNTPCVFSGIRTEYLQCIVQRKRRAITDSGGRIDFSALKNCLLVMIRSGPRHIVGI